MRWVFCVAIVLALTGVARAEDEPKPEVLKKMYAETLQGLKDAQNRKAELAARVADLEKQLAAANAQVTQLKEQAAGFAEKTYFLRTYYAAWRHFIEINPEIQEHWDQYLNAAAPQPPTAMSPMPLIDPEWPLPAD